MRSGKQNSIPRAKVSVRIDPLSLAAASAHFRRAVCAWFAKNARDLPWRHTTDPYAILVSEIMCQQTQVSSVIPYYQRWMRRFPDCTALAAATEHDVMSLWQGLGYYSRARNLHRAAKAVSAKFPRDLEAIRALPGVGRYTAGAVAAFAYDDPAAMVDANIARVLARIFTIREPIDGPGLARAWDFADALQPARNGRKFNSGLMEIGALICMPRSPKCEACPIADYCAARAVGNPQDYPVKKPRKRTTELAEPCALITRCGKVLLAMQTGTRWRGLWKLPSLPERPETAPDFVATYPFTSHKVTLSVYKMTTEPSTVPAGESHAWHSVADLENVPLAAAHRRALERLLGKKMIQLKS